MSMSKEAEITSSSPDSFEDAVNKGLERAGKTLENVHNAWVKDLKTTVENGRIAEYRVTMNISFIIPED